MKNTLLALAMSAVMAITLTAEPAFADKRNRQKNAAIGAAIALGVLGAIAASKNRHDYERGSGQYAPRYRPRRAVNPDQRAIGICKRRTKNLVRRAGGYRTKFNGIRRVVGKPNGRTVVVFDATGFYDYGRKRSRIRCVVKNRRVVRFDFN